MLIEESRSEGRENTSSRRKPRAANSLGGPALVSCPPVILDRSDSRHFEYLAVSVLATARSWCSRERGLLRCVDPPGWCPLPRCSQFQITPVSLHGRFDVYYIAVGD